MLIIMTREAQTTFFARTFGNHNGFPVFAVISDSGRFSETCSILRRIAAIFKTFTCSSTFITCLPYVRLTLEVVQHPKRT